MLDNDFHAGTDHSVRVPWETGDTKAPLDGRSDPGIIETVWVALSCFALAVRNCHSSNAKKKLELPPPINFVKFGIERGDWIKNR